jgi:hypothetical protein
MRHMGLVWVATVGLAIVGAPLAQAAVTCRVIPSWCPATDKNPSGGNGGSTASTPGSTTATKTSVPEPATLMLLAAGAGAAGMAMRRRRRKD